MSSFYTGAIYKRAPVSACPHYIGTIADADQYPLELSTTGSTLYVVTYDPSGDTIGLYDYPALTSVSTTASSGEPIITSIAVDTGGTLVIGTGSGTVLKWNGSSWSTIYTSSSGRTVAARRWCDNPDNAALVETRDISGTKNVRISDMVISSGSASVVLTEQAIGGSGETGEVGAPVTTPDGAVWFTFYPGSRTPGRIYRWHPDDGLQRTPLVGIDTDFTIHPGPYTDTGIDLVPNVDSSVSAHFNNGLDSSIESGNRVSSSLVVSDDECFNFFRGGPDIFDGVENQARIAASAATPSLSKIVLSPFNGAFNYYWGT